MSGRPCKDSPDGWHHHRARRCIVAPATWVYAVDLDDKAISVLAARYVEKEPPASLVSDKCFYCPEPE